MNVCDSNNNEDIGEEGGEEVDNEELGVVEGGEDEGLDDTILPRIL